MKCTKVVKYREILEDQSIDWCTYVDYLLSFIELIMTMISFVDIVQPCLGETYNNIDIVIEKLRGIIVAKENEVTKTFFKGLQIFIVE